MANWVWNKLYVYGPRRDIELFKLHASGRLKAKDRKRIISEKEPEYALSFEEFIPQPDDDIVDKLYLVAREDHSERSTERDSFLWEEPEYAVDLWNIDNWGTGCNAVRSMLFTDEPNKLIYGFSTPWSGARGFAFSAHKIYHRLRFSLHCYMPSDGGYRIVRKYGIPKPRRKKRGRQSPLITYRKMPEKLTNELIWNKLYVYGPERDIELFRLHASGRLKTAPRNSCKRLVVKGRPKYALQFDEFIPMPPGKLLDKIYLVQREVDGRSRYLSSINGGEPPDARTLWALDNWGCRGEAMESELIEQTPTKLVYKFNTRHSGAREWMMATYSIYRDLQFSLHSGHTKRGGGKPTIVKWGFPELW